VFYLSTCFVCITTLELLYKSLRWMMVNVGLIKVIGLFKIRSHSLLLHKVVVTLLRKSDSFLSYHILLVTMLYVIFSHFKTFFSSCIL